MDKNIWFIPVIASTLLVGIAQYDFLTFHTLVELFAIVISYIMFSFAWNSLDLSKNSFLLFLACGYFWIGSLDLIHAFSYKGMNLFMVGEGNTSSQFWIVTRYAESLLLLTAPILALKKLNKYILFSAFGILPVVLAMLIATNNFPTTFVEGVGLTAFKVYSEYAIMTFLLLALLSLFKSKLKISAEEKVLISASIIMTICAEMAFTFYTDVYGFANLVGHIFKLFSFWLIFQAIIILNLKKPFYRLQNLQAYNRSLFENSTTGLVVSKLTGELIDVNLAYANILGYTVEEILTTDYRKRTPAKYRLSQQSHLQELINDGVYGPYEKEYIHKKGHLVPVKLTGRLIESEGETLIWSSVEDITEYKRANALLQDSETRFRTVFDNIGLGTIVFSTKGDIQMFSPSAEDIFGYTAEEVIENNVSMLISGADFEKFGISFEDDTLTINSEKVVSDQKIWGQCKNGEKIALHMDINQMEIAGKTCFLGTFKNLTEIDLLEEQLRQLQKTEAIGHLTGGVAHDFNNLLTIIKGNLSLLEMDMVNKDKISSSTVKSKVDEAIKAVDSGAGLTSRLLAFSRQQVLNPETLNLDNIVGSMEKMLKRTIGEDIEINLDLNSQGWMLEADSSQIENSLLNLSINARDAMVGGGKLTISTKAVSIDADFIKTNMGATLGDKVLLEISDNGAGMDENTLEKVFDPFFTTKGVGKGTGLGLSMVYGFVKQSGGYITINSELGVGTIVRIYLPRSTNSLSNTKTIPNEIIKTNSMKNILLVEDEDGVRDVTVQILDRIGYKVIVANNGKSAIKALESNDNIDLVICDIVLPGGMKGTEVAKIAKSKKPDIKLLFISGYTDGEFLEQEDFPNSRFLSKPFSTIEIAKTISEIFDRN